MSFLEHLDELRQRLIKSLLSLVVGFAVCWGFAEQIFAIMTQPMKKSFPDVTFIYTQPTEAFLLYMKMSFFVGIFVWCRPTSSTRSGRSWRRVCTVTRRSTPSHSSFSGASSSWVARRSGTSSSSR